MESTATTPVYLVRRSKKPFREPTFLQRLPSRHLPVVCRTLTESFQQITDRMCPVPETPELGVDEVSKPTDAIASRESAVFMTNATAIPSHLNIDDTQVIKFGTGLEFTTTDSAASLSARTTYTVLPCIWGTEFQGPMLLATGACPSNVPFSSAEALLEYYRQLKSAVFLLNDGMTDNARNLAPAFRMNAVFIVQPQSAARSEKHDDIVQYLDAVTINGVTALAGP